MKPGEQMSHEAEVKRVRAALATLVDEYEKVCRLWGRETGFRIDPMDSVESAHMRAVRDAAKEALG